MQLASYQICKIAGCACAGNAGNIFPATDSKGNRWLVIPACIMVSASRTCRDACRDRLPAVVGKTFPVFPAHAQPTILCICQEAHLVIESIRIIEDQDGHLCNRQNPLWTSTHSLGQCQSTQIIYLRKHIKFALRIRFTGALFTNVDFP